MFWISPAEDVEMVEINLLPWRTYRKEYIKNKNKQLALAVLLVFIVMGSILHFILIHQVKIEKQMIYFLHKQMINHSAQNNTKSFNNEISLKNIAETFQRNRLQWIDFFNRLAKSDNIYWDAILTQDNQVILTGETNSYQTLFTFVHGYDELKNKFIMDIIKIKQSSASEMLEFSLRVYQVIYPVPNVIEKLHV